MKFNIYFDKKDEKNHVTWIIDVLNEEQYMKNLLSLEEEVFRMLKKITKAQSK